MDQASFCIVLRVPGMNCAALCDHCAIQFLPFSTQCSYTSILTQYGVIIEMIFFFYICTFCISFLSIGFECIWTILCDSVRILSLRCVDWSQYVCRQERKRLYQVSTVFGHSDSVATLCTFVISDELIFTVCIGQQQFHSTIRPLHIIQQSFHIDNKNKFISKNQFLCKVIFIFYDYHYIVITQLSLYLYEFESSAWILTTKLL